jgi:carboxyl-terminal processing protease
MQNGNSKFRTDKFYVFSFRFLLAKIGLSCLALIVFSSSGYGLAARPAEPSRAGLTESEAVEIDEAGSLQSYSPAGRIEEACELICRGEFDAAGELIENVPSRYDTNLHRLSKIVYEYRAMSQQRQAAREAAYRQHLAELEKFRSNDINDTNDVTKVLAVITQASEFADDVQKDELLSAPFVKGTFQRAIDRADEFESKGQWLDSYLTCYSWLQAIEPDNEGYSDYAEQLVEKANIVASFQDSPCETCEQRHEKVEKQMFVRAINALNFNYVSIVDYRRMAAKAVRRCELLAEVISSSDTVRDAVFGKASPLGNDSEGESRKGAQFDRKLAVWSAALAAILDKANQSPTGFGKNKLLDIFEKVLALNTTTVQLPEAVLIAQFAEAALAALDPYTVMVWPRQVQDFEKTMTNEFTGIGIEITKEKGLLTVASLLPDTPAYNSGLDAGDVIEQVDGVETKDMSLTCAVRKITGPAGTKVTLTIRRSGEDKTRDIPITRARIIVPTIRGWRRTEAGKWLYMVDDENKIGYVRITSFSATTASDLEKALARLEAEGLRGLIMDLRFNSGGLLDSAVGVADKFIDEGLIVKTQPRFIPTYEPARKEGTHPDYPLVVLTNRFSASGSEIVAGALHDKAHRRAVLVGERTLGKGLVQGITAYPGGGAQLKYTMAYYHLPSGQRVESQDAMKKQGREDWGVGPDIDIRLRSDELRKVIAVQRDNDVLVQAHRDDGSVRLRRHPAEETLAADPHLAVGLLVVKCKLIREEAEKARQEITVL